MSDTLYIYIFENPPPLLPKASGNILWRTSIELYISNVHWWTSSGVLSIEMISSLTVHEFFFFLKKIEIKKQIVHMHKISISYQLCISISYQLIANCQTPSTHCCERIMAIFFDGHLLRSTSQMFVDEHPMVICQ